MIGTRDRIKAEAMRLCVAHGVNAVSVREIAAAVGMKAPNLYAHFPSKAALLQELFEEGFSEYAATLAELRGASALARLEAMIRRICLLHDTDTIRFRFLLLTQHGSLATLPPGFASPIDVVRATIDEAMVRGEIPPSDAELLTAMIVGVVIQAATFRLYGRLARDLVAMTEEIVAACRRLLAGRSFHAVDSAA